MGFVSAVKTLWQDIRKWTWHHLVVFLITFFLYAVYHSSRKAFSNVKNLMGMSLSPMNSSMYPYDVWQKERMFASPKDANVFFGELDLLFMLSYAIGLFISGIIGDRVNLRYMLSIGMGGSAVVTFLFGYLFVPYNIHNKMYFRSLFFINGFFQSTGWPALMAVIGNWFDKSSSGLVFGIWSSNSNLGNVIGSLLVASVIDHGFEYGMLVNSIVALVMSIIVFFCLVPHPKEVGINTAVQKEKPDDAVDDKTESFDMPSNNTSTDVVDGTSVDIVTKENPSSPSGHERKKAISFLEACMIPGVLCYSFSFACLKMVTYAFFFWLPTYLTQQVHWGDKISDRLSNIYDIGGVIGSVLSGVVSDFIGMRSPVVSGALVLAIICLYLYNQFVAIYAVNVTLMVFSGIMLAGPAALICTVIATDLGKHEKIGGNAQALATVSGIIDGTGSLGASLGQYIVGLVQKYYGWEWVFKFLMIMIAISWFLISPILIKELTMWRNKRRTNTVNAT